MPLFTAPVFASPVFAVTDFADRSAKRRALASTPSTPGAPGASVQATGHHASGHHGPVRLLWAAFALLTLLVLLAPTAANAQPVVRESFEAWQIQCETPAGSSAELCALVQNVAAVDRPNVELRVTIVRTLDGGAHILRVAAPLGVLLDGGLGLRIDDTDIGTADFARCLPSGCYVEMIMEQELVNTLSTGTTAWFVIFQTPDEGIGIPIELAGFSAGFAALN